MADALREQQSALARHLRDPAAHPPPPGFDERRLALYRRLFFNNIHSLLSANFPVLRRTLGDAAWRDLARAFYARHRSRTPLFPEIGREFVRFAGDRAANEAGDPPWLAELAHYEWVELALRNADEAAPPHDPGGDLLAGIPVLSPHAWPLAYGWPVPRIGPDFRPASPPDAPTLLLVRRDTAGEIRFAEISPLVYRLLEILATARSSGREALQTLAGEAGAADLPGFVAAGAAMLQRMRDEGTLLGTMPP